MITLLSRIWIHSDNYRDSGVREKYGVLCGSVGIFLNVLLFAGKFIAGLLSGAISVTADAFNNLSDAGSSVISMIGFKLSGRKPDSDHPFGHGRIEYISGLFVAIIILLMAYELIKESIEKQKTVFKNLKEQKEATLREVEKMSPKVKELEAAYDAINHRIAEIRLQPLPFEWNTELQAKEQELRNFKVDTSKYDNEIKQLEEQSAQLHQNAYAAVEQERAEIERQIEELKAERDELNIAKSKYLTKVQVQENYDLAVAKRNDHEAIYNTINDVIHTMIDMCNKKAYEKTGFEFVMLEETLSETVKEVCYMVVDGVPFANVNTSRKAIIGTLFISKVKDILVELGTPKNDLPILFDKLESISLKTFEDNKQVFENCQFIGTKVTEGKEIKVC